VRAGVVTWIAWDFESCSQHEMLTLDQLGFVDLQLQGRNFVASASYGVLYRPRMALHDLGSAVSLYQQALVSSVRTR
jgi:hypothetical protein